MSAADPFGLVGQILDGQFRVENLVGEGGFSVVYKGRNVGLGEPIAIKCLKLPPMIGSELVDTFVQRFRDESRILYRLSQGNLHIVRSIAAGTTKVPQTGALLPYMVLEWLEGKSLASDFTVRRAANARGRKLREIVDLFGTAADALSFAHGQGVVHRDLNPGNFFLAKTPQGVKMKVLDFGVAKVMRDSTLGLGQRAMTMQQLRIFAPAYGAPEQFDDTIGPIGAWTDVYAFALVLLEAMRDKVVNDGENLAVFAQAAVRPDLRPTPRLLALDVNDEVESAFARATKLDPNERWQNVADFWRSLSLAVQTGVSQPPPRLDKNAMTLPLGSETVPRPAPPRPAAGRKLSERPPAATQRFGKAVEPPNIPPPPAPMAPLGEHEGEVTRVHAPGPGILRESSPTEAASPAPVPVAGSAPAADDAPERPKPPSRPPPPLDGTSAARPPAVAHAPIPPRPASIPPPEAPKAPEPSPADDEEPTLAMAPPFVAPPTFEGTPQVPPGVELDPGPLLARAPFDPGPPPPAHASMGMGHGLPMQPPHANAPFDPGLPMQPPFAPFDPMQPPPQPRMAPYDPPLRVSRSASHAQMPPMHGYGGYGGPMPPHHAYGGSMPPMQPRPSMGPQPFGGPSPGYALASEPALPAPRSGNTGFVVALAAVGAFALLGGVATVFVLRGKPSHRGPPAAVASSAPVAVSIAPPPPPPPLAVDTPPPVAASGEPVASASTPAPASATAIVRATATATATATAAATATTATAVPAWTSATASAAPKPAAAVAVDPNAFDESAARARLAQANGVLVFCKRADGLTGPGSAQVTFGTDGSVTTVVLDPPYAGTKEGDCVAGHFRRAKVAAFEGGPKTLKHAFQIPK